MQGGVIYLRLISFIGATENAGQANAAISKMQGWKMRDCKSGTKMQGWKMQHQPSMECQPRHDVYLRITRLLTGLFAHWFSFSLAYACDTLRNLRCSILFLFSHFPVLHIPPLHVVPHFPVPHFPFSHFQRPRFITCHSFILPMIVLTREGIQVFFFRLVFLCSTNCYHHTTQVLKTVRPKSLSHFSY